MHFFFFFSLKTTFQSFVVKCWTFAVHDFLGERMNWEGGKNKLVNILIFLSCVAYYKKIRLSSRNCNVDVRNYKLFTYQDPPAQLTSGHIVKEFCRLVTITPFPNSLKHGLFQKSEICFLSLATSKDNFFFQILSSHGRMQYKTLLTCICTSAMDCFLIQTCLF